MYKRQLRFDSYTDKKLELSIIWYILYSS